MTDRSISSRSIARAPQYVASISARNPGAARCSPHVQECKLHSGVSHPGRLPVDPHQCSIFMKHVLGMAVTVDEAFPCLKNHLLKELPVLNDGIERGGEVLAPEGIDYREVRLAQGLKG